LVEDFDMADGTRPNRAADVPDIPSDQTVSVSKRLRRLIGEDGVRRLLQHVKAFNRVQCSFCRLASPTGVSTPVEVIVETRWVDREHSALHTVCALRDEWRKLTGEAPPTPDRVVQPWTLLSAEREGTMRELLRFCLNDEGGIGVTVTPWCAEVADEQRATPLANEIGELILRRMGLTALRDFRKRKPGSQDLLSVGMDNDGAVVVEIIAPVGDQTQQGTLANEVAEAVMRTFGPDVLREFRALNRLGRKGERPS
jgi:hypothetical protein